MLEYENYIFDLYGTLVDIRTNETKKYLWDKMAIFYSMNEAKYDSFEFKSKYKELCFREMDRHNNPDVEIDIDYVFAELYRLKKVTPSNALIKDTSTIFRTISLEHICIYDGAKELLLTLKRKGKRVYLLSNAQYSFTMAEIKMLGIEDCFDKIYISSKVGYKKPSSNFFEALIKNEKLDIKKSIMIGNDLECDMNGAKKCGIDGFYILSNISPKKDSLENDIAKFSYTMEEAYSEILKL